MDSNTLESSLQAQQSRIAFNLLCLLKGVGIELKNNCTPEEISDVLPHLEKYDNDGQIKGALLAYINTRMKHSGGDGIFTLPQVAEECSQREANSVETTFNYQQKGFFNCDKQMQIFSPSESRCFSPKKTGTSSSGKHRRKVSFADSVTDDGDTDWIRDVLGDKNYDQFSVLEEGLVEHEDKSAMCIIPEETKVHPINNLSEDGDSLRKRLKIQENSNKKKAYHINHSEENLLTKLILQRRNRIFHSLKTLQMLVPNGESQDVPDLLENVVSLILDLRKQVKILGEGDSCQL